MGVLPFPFRPRLILLNTVRLPIAPLRHRRSSLAVLLWNVIGHSGDSLADLLKVDTVAREIVHAMLLVRAFARTTHDGRPSGSLRRCGCRWSAAKKARRRAGVELAHVKYSQADAVCDGGPKIVSSRARHGGVRDPRVPGRTHFQLPVRPTPR